MGLVLLLLLIVVLVTVLGGALRGLLGAWMDHRVRAAVLESMERNSESLESADDAEALFDRATHGLSPSGRADPLITGATLGVIGLVCVIGGWSAHVGQLAVGVFVGGIVCLALGGVLCVFGLLTRSIARGRVKG